MVRLDEYAARRIWKEERKQSFLDTLLRRWYVPPIVLREKPDSTCEILDGQQRVSVIRDFRYGKILIPQSLGNVLIFQSLVGRKFTDLPEEIQEYMRIRLTLNADVIKGISEEYAVRLFFDLHPGLLLGNATCVQI